MKRFIFTPVLLFAALCLGTSCTNSIADADTHKAPSYNSGYLKLAIQLPYERSTRAENDQFDNGRPEEYEVKNVKVLLFQGKTENTAKFHSAYELTPQQINATASGNKQISAIISVTNQVDNSTGHNLFPLVVINDNGLIHVAYDHRTATINIPGQPEFVFNDKTLADLESNYCKGSPDNVTKNGLLMINAPLASMPGGDKNPSAARRTIMPNATNYFYASKEEAEKRAAVNVTVERCVAKVTVQNKNGIIVNNNIVKADDDSGERLTWKVLGWCLDITNRQSYLVRNITTVDQWIGLHSNAPSVTNAYRFVGHSAVDPNAKQPLYRTYWGIDPNYESYTDSDFTYLDKNNVIDDGHLGNDAPQYCFENTTDVAHMKLHQLTRAVIKVQVGNGEDLFTIHSDKQKVYTRQLLNDHIKGHIAQSPWAISAWQNQAYPKGNMPHLLPVANDVSFEWQSVNDYSYPYSGGIKSMTLHYTDAETGEAKTITYTNESTDALAINKMLNLGEILIYPKGISYFGVPIKHFGDELTPWRKGETPTVSAEQTYPAANVNNNYLGRYGVVRNNWYDIEVNDVTQMGSPVIPPESPNIHGDDYDEHLKVNTQVRYWRQRNQGAHF